MKLMLHLLLPLLMLAGCASSHITQSWTSGDISSQSKKILLVGLVNDEDRSLHDNMEKHMAADLAALGYAVEVLSKEYDTISRTDRQQLLQKEMAKDSIDIVLTLVLLNKKNEPVAIRNEKTTRNNEPGYNLWDYSQRVQKQLSEPGYYANSTQYYWETAMYDVKQNKLVYIASTRSFDPASTESLAHEYGKKLVHHMQKKGVLKK